jgi:dephospho-CoA kinase
MKIFGLTGSIGMGKSTAAKMLRALKVPVYCADEAVHGLLASGGGAVLKVKKLYPAAFKKRGGKGFIDRKILGKAAFHDKHLMKKLEAILHPLVRKEEQKFLKAAKAKKAKAVVLDIPLLFETGGESRVDAVIVVTASAHVQAQRVLKRKGMTAEKLHAIRKAQMPDAEKRKRADIVVRTDKGFAFTKRELSKALKAN